MSLCRTGQPYQLRVFIPDIAWNFDDCGCSFGDSDLRVYIHGICHNVNVLKPQFRENLGDSIGL